jgi:conjugative transfer signal peptidase TraF
MLGAAAAVVLTTGTKPPPTLVWNSSESVPVGLYHVRPIARLTVTDLVVAVPPQSLATFLADGGYLPRGLRVLALPGRTVCRTALAVVVDGIEMGAARARDRRGRTLPDWQGCHLIARGEIFLMNWDEPWSLDGRYFGTIPLTAIIGRAVPLWTFEED